MSDLSSTEEERFNFLDENDQKKFEGYEFPERPAGRTPSVWTDELLMERVKKISLPDLTRLATRRALTHKVLQFFLTGTTAYSSISTLFLHFIAALEWFDVYGETSYQQPIYQALIDGGVTIDCSQVVDGAPNLETVLRDFAQRLTAESVVKPKGRRKRMRGRVRTKPPGDEAIYNLALDEVGLSNISKNRLVLQVKTYYEYVDLYFDQDVRNQQPRSFSQKCAATFLQSLYLLALICFRSRAKRPESVKKYLLSGGYYRLMKKLRFLFNDDDHFPCSYTINPVTGDSFMELLKEFYEPKDTSIEIAVVLIYYHCKTIRGLSRRYAVECAEVIPKEATLRSEYFHSDLAHMLEGGCMQRLRYKGLTLVKLVDELRKHTSGSPREILSKINTTATTTLFLNLCEAYDENDGRTWEPRSDGKYTYTSPQTTWRYSRCVDDTAFIHLATKPNTQFIWRLHSVISRNDNLAKAKPVKYAPSRADEKYVGDAIHRLFKLEMRPLIPTHLLEEYHSRFGW